MAMEELNTKEPSIMSLFGPGDTRTEAEKQADFDRGLRFSMLELAIRHSHNVPASAEDVIVNAKKFQGFVSGEGNDESSVD
jgi:hypothetical protein